MSAISPPLGSPNFSTETQRAPAKSANSSSSVDVGSGGGAEKEPAEHDRRVRLERPREDRRRSAQELDRSDEQYRGEEPERNVKQSIDRAAIADRPAQADDADRGVHRGEHGEGHATAN